MNILDKIDALNPLWGIVIVAAIVLAIAFIFLLLGMVLYASRMSKTEEKAYAIPPENLDLCDPPKREPVAQIYPEEFDDDNYWSLMNMQG